MKIPLANKTKGFSSRYINDFNQTSSFEPIYDYDNAKTEIDKLALLKESTKNDDNLEIIYPDPEDFHMKMLNKSRMENQLHHDDTVIKICELNERTFMMNIWWRYVIFVDTTRIRQPKDKSHRFNQSHELNNDDLNVSKRKFSF